jgi:cellulase
MIDYLASCNGDCTTVDKTALLFSKIDEAGLINGSPAPGTWASDTMIASNNSWTVTLPSNLAAGKYVLRHETIALHSAENLDGSQAYPQCVNLEVTGAGTNTLSTGTIAQDFYKDTDPGILINIYYPPLTSYTIPGPALLADAVSATQPAISGSATATAAPTASSSVSGATTSKMAVPTGAPYSNATMTSASPTDTKPATHPSAIPTTSSSSKPVASSPSTQAATATTSNAAAQPTHPIPMSSIAAPTETSTSTCTMPISFTSTLTGRMGRPTKFTCYIDED